MIWFVGRHAGAREWARQQGLQWQREAAHLEEVKVSAGDLVYGTLPCSLAAEVCAAGAEYWHLDLPATLAWRGRELSADDLAAAGARFVRYEVRRVAP